MRLTISSILLTVAFIGVSSGAASAQALPADIVLKVRGMVCSFCVQGVEKKLLAVPAVKKVVVKLKEKSVQLWLHHGQMPTDGQLKDAIESAGYNLQTVVRKASTSSTTNGGEPKSAVPPETVQ